MSVVEQVKQRIDIVDLVSESVKLRKSGKAYAGLCPFHSNTRTPAFYVFPDTQSWHCFGSCGTGGDIFTFVMKKQNVDFREALRMLAERAGVELQPAGGADNLKVLYEINAAAASFYAGMLKGSREAQYARDYLARRQIKPASIELFQLGFAPPSVVALQEHLRGQEFAPEDIERAGLVSPNEAGGGFRDRFRGRLMFPIRNRRRQIIAFGARALAPEQQPKYLNSPDTSLFSKRDTLYGIDLAQDSIKSENLAILVEGYTDVIIAHQAGFRNVVATLGTALTERQLGQLGRLTKRYALALDADEAGAAATERGLELARQALTRKQVPVPIGPGLVSFEERLDAELLIISLPQGRDPDEVILEGPDKWRELVNSALPLVDFEFKAQTRDLELSTAHGKAEAVKRLAPIIREIHNPIQRAHYTQELARLVQADERVIAQELQARVDAARGRRAAEPTSGTVERRTAARYDEYLITLLLAEPGLLDQVSFLSPEDWEDGTLRALWQALQDYSAGAVYFDADEFVEGLDEAWRETGERLRQAARELPLDQAELSREVQAAAYRLVLKRYQNELVQLHHLLAESTAEEAQTLAERVSVVSARIAQARRALDARNVLARPPSAGISRA